MTNYEDLSPETRVWIYQADRLFRDAEEQAINEGLAKFCDQWAAHGTALKSFAKVYKKAFVILFVDESQEPASGCSIDSSVAVIRSIMQQYQVDLLNRMIFAFEENGVVQLLDRTAFGVEVEKGNIKEDTIVFNNLVKNKAEFDSQWAIPFADSWHKNLF